MLSEEFCLDEESNFSERMKIEAAEEMELLGIDDKIIDKFFNDNIIYESIPALGESKPVSVNMRQFIRAFEREKNVVIYHVIKQSVAGYKSNALNSLIYLFVPTFEYEWPFTRAMIRHDRICTVYILSTDHPEKMECTEATIANINDKYLEMVSQECYNYG